jgi:hypothetical protein
MVATAVVALLVDAVLTTMLVVWACDRFDPGMNRLDRSMKIAA